MATPTARAEELIRLLTTPDLDRAEIDQAANELLSVLFGGLPATALVPLLRSTNVDAVKAGAWLVSELGENAEPIIGEVPALLASPEAYVRHFAMDAVITVSAEDDGELVAQGIGLVRDPNAGVRDKVVRLLWVATTGRLAAALPHITDDDVRALTSWLLRWAEDPAASAEARARLGAPDPTERCIALALALRIADRDGEPLEYAAESPDPDIASLAAFELRLRSRRRHGRRS